MHEELLATNKTQEDKYDIIGKNFSNKLKELPKEIGIVAEMLICDILFEAQLGNITKYTRMTLYEVYPPSVATSQQSAGTS